ncbi:MAG: transporter substrate-binding domain-containing protein [Alphaproteobacteria bacterium]|nr:transporter substrate-binding domain-containing protein [Alphaproteobacteria bacterium]
MVKSTRSHLFIATLLAPALTLFLGGPSSARADALDDIAKAGIVRIGIFEDFPPFSSAGPDMKSQGYDVDVADILAKALGAKPEFVGVTGQNRIPFLTERKVDLLLSVGESAERAKIIDFTAAYAPYFIAVLGPRSVAVAGPPDLKGKTVAVNRGTLEDTSLTEVAPPGTDIQRFNDYNGVISAFLSGQVQLMVVGNDVGATILAKHPAVEPEQKFQLMNSPDHMAINKNEPRLLQKLNDIIAQIKKDGQLDAISRKWLFQPLPTDL